MDTGVSAHLDKDKRVILGSYYTPRRYVERVGEWLKGIVGEGHVILDPSCGYGAFFALASRFPQARYVGNDIDTLAVAQAQKNFPFVSFHSFNALQEISRERYGVREDEPLVIVGNPPYNDTTSLVGRQRKRASSGSMEGRVRTRDLGMSSLLAYEALKADWVAVLHPLSYLVKRANHRACGRFFANYRLREHVVFSSQEFSGTSRIGAFPVVVALYQRCPGRGLSYEDVQEIRFQTVEGETFCLADLEFVSDCVAKYPNPVDQSLSFSGYYFYTLRDLNALRRCRTFLPGKSPNAVAISQEQLPYYHYIDCFKHLAKIPYWAGNLNVPFHKEIFSAIAPLAVRYSRSLHPDLFPPETPLTPEELAALKTYVQNALKGKDTQECPKGAPPSGA